MNKQEFISLLEKRSLQLPQVEEGHLLNYYNETVEDHMKNGMSEAEVVAGLDSIDMIVRRVYAERKLFIEEGKPIVREGRRRG